MQGRVKARGVVQHRTSSKMSQPLSEVLESFRSFLQKKRLRRTEVRETILEAALGRSGHFQVEDLVEDIKRAGGDVSAASVYRALPLLVEAGVIEVTEVTGQRVSYEVALGREHHDHLICSECGAVVEFHFEALAELERQVAEEYDYQLTGHHHELIGICGPCRKGTPRA